MKRFTATKLFKVILISSMLLVLISSNPYSFFSPVRNFVLTIFLPFQKVFYSLSMNYQNTVDFFGSIGELKSENQKLLNENRELVAKNAMLNDMQNENAILRQQLELLPRNKYVLIAASVISQDPSGLGNWLEIDKGLDDGVQLGMNVIVSNSILIGRVQEVGAKSAKIILLTNSKSTINAITSENGARGIVKGEYGLSIILDMILQTDLIKVGDNVVSAGMGGDVPRGLFVGTVQDVHNSEDNLFQQAVVTSPIQISKLQNVFVIKSEK